MHSRTRLARIILVVLVAGAVSLRAGTAESAPIPSNPKEGALAFRALRALLTPRYVALRRAQLRIEGDVAAGRIPWATHPVESLPQSWLQRDPEVYGAFAALREFQTDPVAYTRAMHRFERKVALRVWASGRELSDDSAVIDTVEGLVSREFLRNGMNGKFRDVGELQATLFERMLGVGRSADPAALSYYRAADLKVFRGSFNTLRPWRDDAFNLPAACSPVHGGRTHALQLYLTFSELRVRGISPSGIRRFYRAFGLGPNRFDTLLEPLNAARDTPWEAFFDAEIIASNAPFAPTQPEQFCGQACRIFATLRLPAGF